jgi:predicted permease
MPAWFRRLRARWRYRHFQVDLAREIEVHRAMTQDDLEARGLPTSAARTAAARALGNVVYMREASRAVWISRWLDALWQDVRSAWRGLVAGRSTTALAGGILALAMAAATVTFSVVDTIALRALPYGRPGDLVSIGWIGPESSAPFALKDDHAAWRDGVRGLESIAAASAFARLVAPQVDGRSLTLREGVVTANLFAVLQVEPVLGRLFQPADEQQGGHAVAVLTHESWALDFGGDPTVINRFIAVRGVSHQLIGVLPAGVTFPMGQLAPDLFVVGAETEAGRFVPMEIVARLRPDVAIRQVQAQVEHVSALALLERLTGGSRAVVQPLLHRVVGNARSWLLLALAAVGCVLLIACVNVSSLLLARAALRVRELATREALGASRARLVRVLLFEGLLLSIGAIAAAIVLASWGLAFAKAQLPESLVRIQEVALDARVLAVSAAVAVLCGSLSASAPAWMASRRDLLTLIKAGSGTLIGGRRENRVMRRLLVGEVAFITVLLVAATLTIATFVLVTTADLGFDRRHVATIGWSRDWRGVEAQHLVPAAETFRRDVLERARAVPGVAAVGLTSSRSTPLSGGQHAAAVGVPGHGQPLFEMNAVSPGYFGAMGLTLRQGRIFNEGDALGTPRVAIINETAASQFLGGRVPLDETLQLNGPTTIVGVLQSRRLSGPERDVRPEIYVPISQEPSPARGGTLVVRLADSNRDVAHKVARAIRPVLTAEPGAPRFLEDDFQRITAARRFNAGLMALFGVLALAMAAAGVYGMMAFVVAHETRAIGVRMALGASRERILQTVVRDALSVVLIGLAIGIVAAVVASRAFAALVFGVTTTEPVVYAAVAVVLAALGIAASLVPAWRATKVDPLVALRTE